MTTAVQTAPPANRLQSAGAKFFAILLLALGMSLAGFFVDGLTTDRASNHGLLAASADMPGDRPHTVLGIRLADSYRATRRSLHYITLFLGLVFLTYFLLEVRTGRSVHPAQYALVGVGQIVFYLLLLSLSEHLGFDWSFLLAGVSTVALFTVNADWVFHSRPLAARACATFAALYLFIYVLLRVEAYALLVGALTSFAAVALAMFLTRNIDWYGTGSPLSSNQPIIPVASAVGYESILR